MGWNVKSDKNSHFGESHAFSAGSRLAISFGGPDNASKTAQTTGGRNFPVGHE